VGLKGVTALEVQENYPLASLTTFSVGGPARYYASVSSEAAFLDAVAFAKGRDIPIFILGGGSNILVCDSGFDGLVIRNRITGVTSIPEGECISVHAGSGEDWQQFVDWCVSQNLPGVECLAGIPGTVGASPVQNIGAYGQEVSETIVTVRALELDTGKPVVFRGDACGFGYRTSIFNKSSEGRYFITGVIFRFNRNAKPAVAHRELEKRLVEAARFSIGHVRDSVIAIRADKGLLVREGYECFRCAGSFFKNPILPAEKSGEIKEMMQKRGDSASWSWPLGSDRVKISAAALIQSAAEAHPYHHRLRRSYCAGSD
jgi:UDP-N-acetylmuramate dehydrogenase